MIAKNTVAFKVFTELNKYLLDALWRYELVTSIKGVDLPLSKKHGFLSYMLASPESLIYMCLKKGDFEKQRK